MKIIWPSLICWIYAAAVWAAPDEAIPLKAHGDAPAMIESLRRESQAAIDRAAAWLLAHQQDGGYWSNDGHPALTALPLWALVLAGQKDSPPIRRAVDFLLACARDNGAIYRDPDGRPEGGGLSNYNTALSMTALHLSGDPRATPVVLNARRYMVRSQHLGGDIYHGGMGYDAASGRAYADLSNSYIAFEAMRLTESAEDVRADGEARADLDWAAARQFIQRTHNDARFNESPWASDDPSDRGGFAYHPEQTRAGTFTNRAGVVKFRSMPGMTYAGLLSYIYAEVDRTDPRVEATIEWVVRHWGRAGNRPGNSGDPKATKDENEGLFYLLNVMAKGLAVYGRDVFRPPGRDPFNWRVHLVEELISSQRVDPATGHGYWVNDVGRYWESDPVLVTSYALIALRIATGEE